MKKVFLAVIVFLFAFLFVVCNSSNLDRTSGIKSDSEAYEHPSAPPSYPGGDYPVSEESGDGGNQNKPGAGLLTSAEWSDIKNYSFYLNLFDIADDPDTEEGQSRNSFSQYINYFGFETRYMLTVNVVCGGSPAGDAVVDLYDSDQTILFSAKTDVLGYAYLFPSYDLSGENITIKASSGSHESLQSFDYTDGDLQITLDGQETPKSVLDLMFVIDTTGSMGDELNYLKEEISDVISAISEKNPLYSINLALLFYRDIGDEYVTKYFDFTPDIAEQQKNLSRQSANGGGDFPEAVDKALSEAVEKNWSSNYATRLIFHVCDAPPHDTQENQTLFFNSVKAASKKGIRIIPVASSGIDSATEFLLRQEALMTGGTYIFLTDDSGIGESHLEPTVGEFTVEYLNACMVRVVNEYLTGIETDPAPYWTP